MKHPDRPDRSWRYAYLQSGLLSQTPRYEDGRGDGIEEAVVKNARVPLLAAPSATVSSGSCALVMDVKMVLKKL